jgi:hypothetical protein
MARAQNLSEATIRRLWLNMIERWFRDLTCNRLRRGSFDVEKILSKIAICKDAHDALH